MSAATDTDWRDAVPERFRDLPDMITIADMQEIFGFRPEYLRRLRAARIAADASGITGMLLNALPRALPVSRRPLYWASDEIIHWGIKTGRLDPQTGRVQRLNGGRSSSR